MAAPAFDATAISAASGFVTTGTVALSWSHTVGAGANNYGIVACVINNGGAAGFNPSSSTVTIGSTTLSLLASGVLMGGTVAAGVLCAWGASGIPTGTQTVNMSVTTPSQNVSNLVGTSFTYTGVGSVGTVQSAVGQFGSNAVTVPSATGDTVWGLIGNYQTGTYSAQSFTQRQSLATGTGPFFTAGDQAGSSSVTFSATQSTTYPWAAIGLDLQPAGAPAVPTNAFFSMF